MLGCRRPAGQHQGSLGGITAFSGSKAGKEENPAVPPPAAAGSQGLAGLPHRLVAQRCGPAPPGDAPVGSIGAQPSSVAAIRPTAADAHAVAHAARSPWRLRFPDLKRVSARGLAPLMRSALARPVAPARRHGCVGPALSRHCIPHSPCKKRGGGGEVAQAVCGQPGSRSRQISMEYRNRTLALFRWLWDWGND
jgi:hypothetical protein